MIQTDKLKKVNTYYEGGLSALDDPFKTVANDYKKRLSLNFITVTPEQSESKINGKEFLVSKKIDGHFQLVFWDGKNAFMVGKGGKVRMGLPCLKSFGDKMKNNGAGSGIFAAELFYHKENERTRVYDVSSALADESKLNQLKFAFFDIVQFEGESFKVVSHFDIYKKLKEIFPEDVVETRTAGKPDLKHIFNEWVNEQGGEGLVVKGEFPVLFKIKPKYHYDVVVLGYTEGINEKKGKVKSLLFGFVENGTFRIGGKAGNIPDKDREELLGYFSKKHIHSKYIHTDNEGIAFHMVTPDTVIEISCNDAVTEFSDGEPVMNHIVRCENDIYSLHKTSAGAKFINIVFECIRDDKKPNESDAGFQQVSDVFEIFENDKEEKKLPKSELLFREVYTKRTKDKLMVQKFIVWKTNKETLSDKFPAYVMNYTNFSPGRKNPMQKNVRISCSEKQIMELTKEFIENNIKSGWVKTE